ncbi:hypothetical protein [Paenibacillus ginsengarvi]|uniref:Uncharacterized protein n=1 Tax=Paenibacillus ginsengarvi TaxID=400777 RepID=A0A3B0BK67_9BACL|nr:hypothetical protein [Paenibacillus ginsengarvi]RKN71856.1 hypothetical protein D7M11_28920 [Paenibacillus ginsengarvi]
MNKDILLKLSKTLNTEYEIGIWSETTDFFERQNSIADFSVNYNDNQFNVAIKLKEFSLNGAKTIFALLVRFVEYQSTFYVREDKENSVEYYLLSSTDNKKAFLFHIVFQ